MHAVTALLAIVGLGYAGSAWAETIALPGGLEARYEVVASGLDTPWAVAFAPDGRIFVTERPGRVRLIVGGRLAPDAWLSLEHEVVEAGESGLLGIALDPQFPTNGFIYVAYTHAGAGGYVNRLARYRERAAGGPVVFDRILLDGVPGRRVHDGGRIAFGPDGKLYWGTGDAGSGGNAQDLTSLGGKILRLNPDGSVPADNPWKDSFVYSMGHRNVQGLAWHPLTGRLYATEHGPSSGGGFCCNDEVNLVVAGGNYGWPDRWGDQHGEGATVPVILSGGRVTWAPSGATFARAGPWNGSLLFAGLRGESLYRAVIDPADPRHVITFEQLLTGLFGRLRDVTQGPDGALYLLTSNRDGRGRPSTDDDRLLGLTVSAR